MRCLLGHFIVASSRFSSSNVKQLELDAIARKLHERPRKTLGYQIPAETFNLRVASTG